MHSAPKSQTLEGTLNQDMATLSTYLQKWKLKLSITKTVTAALHLYKEARRELSIAVEGRTLPFLFRTYFVGIKLDRSPTYCQPVMRKRLLSHSLPKLSCIILCIKEEVRM